MIVPGMFVCSSFLISVCMFIVSKALLISSATVIVRAGGAIWLNPFATVLFSVCSAVTVECCVLYQCCMGVFGMFVTRHTLAQPRTNKSPFLKSYQHKVDDKSHPSPLCPICTTHTHNTHHLFNCTYMRTTLSRLDLSPAGVTALLTRWTEKLSGGTTGGKIRLPPLARVKGVGRQQQ